MGFTVTLYNTNNNTPTGTIATTGPIVSLPSEVGIGYLVGTSNPGNPSDMSSWFFVAFIPNDGSGLGNTIQLFTGVDMPSYAYLVAQAGTAPNFYSTTYIPATSTGTSFIAGPDTFNFILLSPSPVVPTQSYLYQTP